VTGTARAADPTAALDGVLSGEQAHWLAGCCAAAGDPQAVRRAFPAVGRRLGRGPLRRSADPADLHEWTVDDAGRVRLLRAAADRTAGPATLLALLQQLYGRGDATERRGVLRALDVLPVGPEALTLVRDALRTNDARLVAAAVAGRYAARLLPAAEFDQAVLKCLFVGIPLAGLAGLPARAGPGLARMVADFARERIAAGRTVPADAWLVLDRQPDVIVPSGLLGELSAPVAERRTAAERFFAVRPGPPPASTVPEES
jgi:hypothetical protein